MKRLRLYAAFSIAALTGMCLGGVQAQAEPAAQASSMFAIHTQSGCGAPLTVYTPKSASIPESAFVAAGGHAFSASPLIARALKQHAKWLSNFSCVARPDRTRPVIKKAIRNTPATPADACNSPLCSANWSGYQAYVSGVAAASGEWTIPNVDTLENNTSTASSIWPGIGQGTSNSTDELIQAGSEQDQICLTVGSGCTYSYEYFMWFEMYPDEYEEEVTNITPSPGDDVATESAYDGSNGQADFLICDYTKNFCGTASQQSPAPPSATSEWITERPDIDFSYDPLADFQTMEFTNSYSYTNINNTGYASAGADDATQIQMTNCARTEDLASATALDSTGTAFGVDWNNFGPNEFC